MFVSGILYISQQHIFTVISLSLSLSIYLSLYIYIYMYISLSPPHTQAVWQQLLAGGAGGGSRGTAVQGRQHPRHYPEPKVQELQH